MEKPPALALPMLRMVSEMLSAAPAAAEDGADRPVTVRSGFGAVAAATTTSKLLVVMLLPVLTSPLPRDGLILLVNCIPMVPTGSPLGTGNDTVWVRVCQRLSAEIGTVPRSVFCAGLLRWATENCTVV